MRNLGKTWREVKNFICNVEPFHDGIITVQHPLKNSLHTIWSISLGSPRVKVLRFFDSFGHDGAIPSINVDDTEKPFWIRACQWHWSITRSLVVPSLSIPGPSNRHHISVKCVPKMKRSALVNCPDMPRHCHCHRGRQEGVERCTDVRREKYREEISACLHRSSMKGISGDARWEVSIKRSRRNRSVDRTGLARVISFLSRWRRAENRFSEIPVPDDPRAIAPFGETHPIPRTGKPIKRRSRVRGEANERTNERTKFYSVRSAGG